MKYYVDAYFDIGGMSVKKRKYPGSTTNYSLDAVAPPIEKTIQYNGSSGTLTDHYWDYASNVLIGDALNVGLHGAKMRDYFLGAPFNYAHSVVIAAVNEQSSFRGHFSYGGSIPTPYIGFGDQSAKRWARSSEVVYHEYTHNIIYWLYNNHNIGDDDYSTDPQSDAMDEGFANYFAVAKWCATPGATCNSKFEEEIYENNQNLYNNWALDTNEPPGGTPHQLGLIVAGAAWDLRQGRGGITGIGQKADKLVFWALKDPYKPAYNFLAFLKKLYKFDTDLFDQENFFAIQQSFRTHGMHSAYSTVGKRWNMVSVPVGVSSFKAMDVWQEATQVKKYNYTIGNNPYDDVPLSADVYQGIGYWAKFPNLGNYLNGVPRLYKEIPYVGYERKTWNVNVKPGWNMIGSISYYLPTDKVTTSSGVSILSNFFGYNGSYYITTTITPGWGYWVKVSAPADGSGYLTLDINNPTSSTPPPSSPPAAPILRSPANNATGVSLTPSLTWNSVETADRYHIQISTSSSFSTVMFEDVAVTPANPTDATVTIQASGLNYSQDYWWRVKAINLLGAGSWSTVWKFKTGSAPPPPPDPCPTITSVAELDQFIITDAYENQQILYARNDSRKIKPTLFKDDEMPPSLPDGVFDMRFKSGKFIESVKPGEKFKVGIKIKNAKYPIKFHWSIKRDNLTSYWLKKSENEKELELSGANSLVFETVSNEIVVIAQSAIPGPCQPAEESGAGINTLEEKGVPKQFLLEQNYPNPFNPSTIIKYQLPTDSKVKVKIYNIFGQEIVTLADEVQSAGYKNVEWNSKNNFGNTVSSGVYFYKIDAIGVNEPSKTFIQVRKMLLLR